MPSFLTTCCVWIGAVLSLPLPHASDMQPQASTGHLERLTIHSNWAQERSSARLDMPLRFLLRR